MLLLGSTVVPCSASSTAALEEFHIFYVTVGSHWKSEHYFNELLL